MNNCKYRASLIIPVFNAEPYLSGCLASVWHQDIDKSELQIIIIDDGSTDGSYAICESYQALFNNCTLISRENKGVSYTRNEGISLAEGKYIFYLDADDTIGSNVIRSVCDFFDKHYDEVDIVSYYDEYLINGTALDAHARYKILKSTGIYDLEENPYCMQVRLSMAVKNEFENNHYFDTEIGYQEDQKYCSEILMDKMKLGFVKEAKYYYNKNDSSIVGTNTNSIVLFEKSTKIFEEIFDRYDVVPRYFQALFFHDIHWKFMSTCLYPYHYSENELKIAKDRIINLLKRIDSSIIMQSPEMDSYQKLYWLRVRNKAELSYVVDENNLYIFAERERVYYRKDIEVVIKRIRILKNGNFVLFGFFKSPIFSFTEDVKFFVVENSIQKELEVNTSSSSYYKAKEKTDQFYGFSYECNTLNTHSLEFAVSVDGFVYSCPFWITPEIACGDKHYKAVAAHGLLLKWNNKQFFFERVSKNICDEFTRKNSIAVKDCNVNELREFYILNQDRNVWIYVDNCATAYDNGWLQFVHDYSKNDGVERYYICANDSLYSEWDVGEYMSHIIPFGGEIHKALLLIASKILTAFVEKEAYIPYSKVEWDGLKDIYNPEIIYLQHGVLHAHLPWYYSPTNVNVDKEVVSTNFEIENLTSNYGFRECDLIKTGMPRYSYIKDDPGLNKILFAPSWRSYLIGKITTDGTHRAGNEAKLMKSNYYKNLMEFINNPRLSKVLAENDIELHLKFHPEFLSTYGNSVELDLPNIKFITTKVDVSEYKAFMTDFSSFVFDYAILNRPILYFVPDYEEFTAGVNHYRELDLPFEKAFGPLATSPEKAVDELIKIINNKFVPEQKYYERMDKFYLPVQNSCDALYEELIKNNAN